MFQLGRWWIWILVAGLCMFPHLMAQAQQPSGPEPEPLAASAPVRVEGRRLFEVTGEDQLSAAYRADRINRRLQSLITRDEPVWPFTPEDIVTQGGQVLITLGGEPVMTVTTTDAQDHLLSPQELALRWGRQLSAAVLDARAARANPLHGAGILIRNSFRDLVASMLQWLPRLAGAVVLWLLFWLLARGVRWAFRTIAVRTHLDRNLRQLGQALVFYGIWAIGFIAILSTLGFESGSIVAALGVSGFIVGFAFKDILSHFLAGLMLLTGRQFRIGDQIVLREFEGTVERIDLRALHLRTYDNRLVMIPNAEVLTSAVVSNTASPYRRREFVVGIGYDDDIDEARRIALEAVRTTEGVQAEPAPDAIVDELTPSTVNLRIRFYVNSLRADYLRVGSACMQRVKQAFDAAGISMPTEIQTIRLQNAREIGLGYETRPSSRRPAPSRDEAA